MTASELPDDIHAALLKCAKSWLLNNYVGGYKRLQPWSDHYAHLTTIQSYNLPGDGRSNLRRLARLTSDGVLVERSRYRVGPGSVRSFTAPRPALDEIGTQAVREWQAQGYVIGELMLEIKT